MSLRLHRSEFVAGAPSFRPTFNPRLPIGEYPDHLLTRLGQRGDVCINRSQLCLREFEDPISGRSSRISGSEDVREFCQREADTERPLNN